MVWLYVTTPLKKILMSSVNHIYRIYYKCTNISLHDPTSQHHISLPYTAFIINLIIITYYIIIHLIIIIYIIVLHKYYTIYLYFKR